MSITKESKKKIISKFAINKNDTGSTAVQIAVISERIKNLTDHFKNHNKDVHSKRGLLSLVNKRKRLLSYLSKNDPEAYKNVIKKLNLRKYNQKYKEIIKELKIRG